MHNIDNWLLFCQMQLMERSGEEAGETECVCAQLLHDEANRTQPQEI